MLIFFFQAEDGIRDTSVTGVQTCALPIFARPERLRQEHDDAQRRALAAAARAEQRQHLAALDRSEERRVGKEWRAHCMPERREITIERLIDTTQQDEDDGRVTVVHTPTVA